MKKIRELLRWRWGKQTYKGFKQSDDDFRGFAAPLWVNSSPLTFLVMSLWGMTVFLSLVFVYAFYIDGLLTKCNQSFKSLIIFELCVLVINSIFDFFSYLKKYDTDQGWSRSLIYLTFQNILLIICALLGIFYALSNKYTNCPYNTTTNASCELGTPNCREDNTKALFLASIIVTINIVVLLVIKLILLITFSFKYYYEPAAFLAVAKQSHK